MRLGNMGANDRSFKYSVGEWGRKARKYLNNLRRLNIKEETQEEFKEECPEPLKLEYTSMYDEFDGCDVDPEDYEYYEHTLKLQINKLKQEVRELKRDLKNAKLEARRWQHKWWEECFKK